MGAEQEVAEAHDPRVRLGVGLAFGEVFLAHELDDRRELVLEPFARNLLAGHELAACLHRAEAPRLDPLGEAGVPGALRELDAGSKLGRQRHPLEEEPLMALEREVVDRTSASAPTSVTISVT